MERLDPELADALALVPVLDLADLGLARARRRELAAARGLAWHPPPGVDITDHVSAATSGSPGTRVRVYRPRSASGPTPVLLWLHGGGHVIGDVEQDDPFCADLVARTGCTVASVDWRHAPEAPYPAAIEDAYAALAWARSLAPERLVVGGASSGGGLAAGLCLLARDRGEHVVDHQVLIYPMLDDRFETASSVGVHHDAVWDERSNRLAWGYYLSGLAPGAEVPPYAAPSRATDLTGLPPAWIATGELDVFADEDLAYAQALMRAGVSVELHSYPGAYHGFDLLAPGAGVSRRYCHDRDQALDRLLAPTPKGHP